MRTSTHLNLAGFAPVLLYGLALYGAYHSYPHFWTSRAMGANEPWYFIGQVFVEALFTTTALLLTLGFGVLAHCKLGREVWTRLIPMLLFFMPAVGQGVNVLLHTEGIWEEETASTQWKTFDDYLASNSLAGSVTLAATAALAFYLMWRLRRHQGE